MHELISTYFLFFILNTGAEWFVKPSPKILSSKENATNFVDESEKHYTFFLLFFKPHRDVFLCRVWVCIFYLQRPKLHVLHAFTLCIVFLCQHVPSVMAILLLTSFLTITTSGWVLWMQKWWPTVLNTKSYWSFLPGIPQFFGYLAAAENSVLWISAFPFYSAYFFPQSSSEIKERERKKCHLSSSSDIKKCHI